MCTVSNIGDIYGRKWNDYQPPLNPYIGFPVSEVTKAEFEALRKEVLALKELLKAAKKFDEATGQPDCEMEGKVAIIRKVAEAVGVNLDDVFGPVKAKP
jgi:hypothetical protein